MGQVGVPVQVVLADIEYGRSGGLKTLGRVELKARQLKHPDLGQGGVGNHLCKCVEQRGANIAGHGHGFARSAHQLSRKGGHGGLAVGACDGQHGGLVGLAGL